MAGASNIYDKGKDKIDAAAGSDSDVTSTFNRRQFLGLAGGAGAACVLSAILGPKLWEVFFSEQQKAVPGRQIPVFPPKSSHTPKVVLVTLYGGNDGLNTVIPYQSPTYYSNRRTLGIDQSKVLPLGEGFGLHPSMTGFTELWKEGHLAIVQGVGYSNPSFSHFQSMDIWQTGMPSEPTGSGWLGRWLDASKSSPLSAVSIGPTMPTLLVGTKVQGATIPPGNLILPGDASEHLLYELLCRVQSDSSELFLEAGDSGANLVKLTQSMGSIIARSKSSDPLHLKGITAGELAGSDALAISNGGGGQSSSNVLATQLSIVANLILANANPIIYSVDLGGFDTHAGQTLTQARLLAELDTAVTAFIRAMAASSQGNDVLVVIYTEFGRRVSGNSSGGTDHGWANNVFIVGPQVKGGFYGEPPNLNKLQEGNLVFTTDFRTVYATVFEKILNVDSKSFLGGSFKSLPVI